MKKNESILKHFFIISGSTILTLLIGLLTTPIITRLVDPKEYGQLSIFNMYASIALLIFYLGLDQSFIRFYFKKNNINYHRKLLRHCLILPVIVWFICSFIFLILVKFNIINFEFNFFVTICLVICILFQIFNKMSLLLITTECHSKEYSILNILYKIIYTSIIFIFIMFYRFNDLYILVFATMFANLLSAVIGIIFEKNIWIGRVNNKKDKIEIKPLIKYGLPFVLSASITTIFQGIDKISLNYFCTYYDVGIYSSAISLTNVFLVAQTSFNALWSRFATEQYENNKEDKTLFQKGNSYITILMFTMGICMILFKDIFIYLLGEKYRIATYIIPCLCFSPIMCTISESTVNGINFAKKTYLHIWIAVIACITNIIGNIILVPIYTTKGAAISTGISYIVFFLLRTYFSNKCFYVDFKLKKIIILTTIVFLYALYNTFISFNLFTIVGALVCFIVLYILYRNEIIEIISLAKEKVFALKK